MEHDNVLDILKERGFVQQITDEAALSKILAQEKIAAYIGFDPTADSLHAGSLIPIMALMHFQRQGHFPIVVLGDGTAMIGDPSGKTEMRQMLYEDQIRNNCEKIKSQLNRFLKFDEGKAALVQNGDWLLKLNYISFLREIGRHFSVNRMLAAETYRLRLETGLSFLEFNYQLLQAYDFLVLFQNHRCILQMGGDDQWGNIVAGIDLIRRIEGKEAYGLTFPLLVAAGGHKMGKTARGALWLDPEKTTPYEYYQYWVNIDDRDVKRFLAYFTFLPMEEVNRLGALQGADLREAKRILAYEATKLTHGEAAANSAEQASRAIFGSKQGELDGMPTTYITKVQIERGINVVDLFHQVGLVKSKSDGRRLIQQGGCYVNDRKVTSIEQDITKDYLKNSYIILRVGQKRYHRVVVE
ncbi:MAG: tyrosine--tRNA ligase [candidate division KSB1 bacterium]|nr:tyrosine--tRNA ligase [candidate division KSB1 bacterium]MDZ7334217.1 tyrosine--tRNA ligase [candidate division KSB1 bacterium]MDZ7358945.1 tyrosine--tRNA ligase [candidate division KSB1 bacterium]MDZ7400910.1 tyrosine--tRNA ligase [candidate division KSB1 bacterium]